MEGGNVVEEAGVPFVPAGEGVSPGLQGHGRPEIFVGVLVSVYFNALSDIQCPAPCNRQ